MNILEAMLERHSVRRFKDAEIEKAKIEKIRKEINEIQDESKLRIIMNLDELTAFKAEKPHYGNFANAKNYFTIIGKKGMEKEVGYYGERLVLFIQTLGLNSCWVYLTYDKKAVSGEARSDEKVYVLIAFGYGSTMGLPHTSKDIRKISNYQIGQPDWFRAGLDAAILAPTALNQQHFYLELKDNNKVKLSGYFGPCYKIDLGIVKYHFEVAAKRENFEWEIDD